LAFGVVNHGQADAVLHAAARVERFHLHIDFGLETLGDVPQPNERGVADRLQDILVHHGASSVAVARPPRAPERYSPDPGKEGKPNWRGGPNEGAGRESGSVSV